jgi:hypothetical protein
MAISALGEIQSSQEREARPRASEELTKEKNFRFIATSEQTAQSFWRTICAITYRKEDRRSTTQQQRKSQTQK